MAIVYTTAEKKFTVEIRSSCSTTLTLYQIPFTVEQTIQLQLGNDKYTPLVMLNTKYICFYYHVCVMLGKKRWEYY